MNTLKKKWFCSILPQLGLAMALAAGNSMADKGDMGKSPPPASGGKGPYTYNPAPFQNFAASPSAHVRFMLSPQGKTLLRQSAQGREILKALKEDVSAESPTPLMPELEQQAPAPANAIVFDFDGFDGSLFNLEPRKNALPQNEQSVDFLPTGQAGTDILIGGANDYRGFFGLLGGSATGYYVKRAVTSKSGGKPDFEGGLPLVEDPLVPGAFIAGGGDPVIVADPKRNAVFAADIRVSGSTTAIGVFRTDAAHLTGGACPAGTHTAAQAATCWPKGMAVGALPFPFVAYLNDKPHLAVDEANGNVYVSWTEFDFLTFFSRIFVVQCNNALTSCGPPVVASNTDTATQFSHLAVRPDGKLTISWINVRGFPQVFDIKFNDCRPGPLGCNNAKLVHSETQPLPFGGALGAQDFRIATYPKHDHVVIGGKARTVVVWDRCKVGLFLGSTCVDADVVMKQSANGGATWPGGINPVNTSAQDQFFPWIKTDRSRRIVNIIYYSSQNDSPFQHRVQVFLNHLTNAAFPLTVADTHVLTKLRDDPSGDPLLGGLFFGDYIGVAARGTGKPTESRAYTHFTFNNIQGNYNGILAPEQNNHMSRVAY